MLRLTITNANRFVDRDMFMRYRGGGVGHLYMRAIEVWLAETGWGSDDVPVPEGESGNISSDHSSDGDREEDDEADRSIDEDPPESDGSPCATDSEQEDQLDPCSDIEKLSDEEDGETFEGELGFGGY